MYCEVIQFFFLALVNLFWVKQCQRMQISDNSICCLGDDLAWSFIGQFLHSLIYWWTRRLQSLLFACSVFFLLLTFSFFLMLFSIWLISCVLCSFICPFYEFYKEFPPWFYCFSFSGRYYFSQFFTSCMYFSSVSLCKVLFLSCRLLFVSRCMLEFISLNCSVSVFHSVSLTML